MAAAAVLPVAYVHSTPLAIALLPLGYFATQVPMGCLWTLASDSDTARARGRARDLSKLADWDTFWKAAEANECRWTDGRRLVFDNRADGVTADAVARALAELDRPRP
jgi:hypothetical protein